MFFLYLDVLIFEKDTVYTKHLLGDPARNNAMKQTCVIVILAYFTLFYLIPTNLH